MWIRALSLTGGSAGAGTIVLKTFATSVGLNINNKSKMRGPPGSGEATSSTTGADCFPASDPCHAQPTSNERIMTMKEFEVTCVTKPDRYSAHEHITHIGNIAGQWRITRELAIRKSTPRKKPSIRTYADGKWQDNLLALAECNGVCKLIG
jgi:hypothetical protein